MSVRCCLMQCPWLARTSKALGDDRTVDKDATSGAWRDTGDIATIQDHPFIQQELGRANERCREQRLVKISEPDVRETLLENVTRTLQRSGAHPEPQLVLVIPNDSHSGRGVHWTLRIVHIDVHSQCQSQLSRRNKPAETHVKSRSGRMRWEKTQPH
jgi:hypothetical protein